MTQNNGPASPCIGVCEIDSASQNCRGCCRSLDEIAEWPGATPDRQREIADNARQRHENAAVSQS